MLAVAIGGGLGAIARFWLSGAVGRRIGETFPWGTLAVNVTGGAAIGILTGVVGIPADPGAPSLTWSIMATGGLGGYTTVSSFSLQTMSLIRVSEWRSAVANVIASTVLCVSAAVVGFASTNVLMAG